MSRSSVIRAGVVVMPLRFTDQLPQMRNFLALLGFSPRVGRAESWQDMVGGSGMVALHSAASSDQGISSGVTGVDVRGGRCRCPGRPVRTR